MIVGLSLLYYVRITSQEAFLAVFPKMLFVGCQTTWAEVLLLSYVAEELFHKMFYIVLM